jgi:hypothetical protein
MVAIGEVGAAGVHFHNRAYDNGIICFVRARRKQWSSLAAATLLRRLFVLRDDQKFLRHV